MIVNVRNLDKEFSDNTPDIKMKSVLKRLCKQTEPYGYKAINFKGELCLYKRYPDCEVVGVGFNTDTVPNELRMLCVYTHHEIYCISARVYCMSPDDAVEAARMIEKSLNEKTADYPFDLLNLDTQTDLHIIKYNGKWTEGMAVFSFSKGLHAVPKEEARNE